MKHKKDGKKRSRSIVLTINTISVCVLASIFILMGHAPKKDFKEQTAKVAGKVWRCHEDGLIHEYIFHKNGKLEHRHGDIVARGRWEWISINEMSIAVQEQYMSDKRLELDDSDKKYFIRYTKIHEAELVMAEGMLETEFETGFTEYISYVPEITGASSASTAQVVQKK